MTAAKQLAARVPLPEPFGYIYADANQRSGFAFARDPLSAVGAAMYGQGEVYSAARVLVYGEAVAALALGEAVPVGQVCARHESKRDSLGEAYLDRVGIEVRWEGLPPPVGAWLYTTPPAPAVDEAMVERAWKAATKACVVGGFYFPPMLPEEWERAVTAALNAALHGEKA